MSTVAISSSNLSVARAPRKAEWTLRVSSIADLPGVSAPTLVVHGAELLHVLTRLLDDERVNDVVLTPRSREVRARVEAPVAHLLSYGDLVVDVPARDVRVLGERVALTRRELDLLVFFLRNPNRAWSREELLQRVWWTDAHAKRRTVDIHVRRLRAKLGATAAPLETLVGVGYRFATGSRQPAAPAEQALDAAEQPR